MNRQHIRLLLKFLVTFIIFLIVFIIAALLQDWSDRPEGWIRPPIWWLFG